MEGMEGASRADLRVEFKRSELNVLMMFLKFGHEYESFQF